MATNGSFVITVKAVDQTTVVVAKINKAFASQMKMFNGINTSAKGLGKELARTAKITGITNLTNNIRKFGSEIGRVARTTASFVGGLGALSGLASAAGIAAMVNRFSDFNKVLTNNSHIIGVSARDLEVWQKVGELAGVSAETMTNNIQSLGGTMQDALNGRNMTAALAFKQLGISIQGIGANARSPLEIMPQLADKFAAMGDSAGAAVAKANFLKDIGLSTDFLPVLNQGAEGLARFRKEAERYATRSEAGRKAADKFRYASQLLSMSAESLGYQLAEALSPAITALVEAIRPILDRMGDWVKANKALINNKVQAWINDIKIAAQTVWPYIDNAVTSTLGWKNALIGVGSIVAASFAMPIIRFLLAPLRIVTSTLGVLARVLTFVLVPALRLLGTAVVAVGRTILVAMLANPITAAVMAIVAVLAVAAYQIWKHWDSIGPKFWGLWDTIKAKAIVAIVAVQDAWGSFKLYLSDLWDSIESRFWSVWTPMLQKFKDAWNGIKKFFTELWNDITAVFRHAALKMATYMNKVLPKSLQIDLSGLQDEGPASTSSETGTGGSPGAGLDPVVADKVRNEAIRQGVDPNFALAIAAGEHGGIDNISPAGARGTMQLMPDTAKKWGVDASKIDQNIRGGISELKDMLRLSAGDRLVAGARYNAGPAGRGIDHYASTNDASRMPDETQKYVKSLGERLGISPSGPVASKVPGYAPIAANNSPTNGKIQVHIDFTNMPVGVKTSAQNDGVATMRISRTAGPS